METPPTDKIKAALEQLEQERERRIGAKVEAGAAIRVPLLMVATQDLDKVTAAKLAQLRAGGEAREVFFDRMIVSTGVPRGEPISTAKVEADPLVTPRYPKPDPLPVRPARVAPDMREAKRIMATIPPRDERDCGVVFYGQYRVEAGQLHVADDKGQHLTSAPVGPDDDIEMVARRLLRQKLMGNGFDGPLSLPKRSIV